MKDADYVDWLQKPTAKQLIIKRLPKAIYKSLRVYFTAEDIPMSI